MAKSRITPQDLGLTTNSLITPLVYDRGRVMLNYLRHTSNRGRDKLTLLIDDFEYRILLMLCAVGNIIIESRTPTTVTIIVEKP